MNVAVKTTSRAAGFSLVEVLVGLVVFAIGSAATIAVFSNTIRSIFRTDDQATANAAIDSDVAKIKQLAEIYNACSDSGSTLPGSTVPCSGFWPDGSTPIKLGDSYYYYPDPSSSAKVTAFEDACVTPDPSKHITKNFIDYINNATKFPQPPSESKVTRGTATRQAPSNPGDSIVVVTYTTSFNTSRTLKILPVISAWCP